jgi:hypothetical protein
MRDLQYKYRASAWFVHPTIRIVPRIPRKYKHDFSAALPLVALAR